jgi:hypothetical protein
MCNFFKCRLTNISNTKPQFSKIQDGQDEPVDWSTLLEDDDNDNISALSANLAGRDHEEITRFIDDLFTQKFHEEHRDKSERAKRLEETFSPCTDNKRTHYLVLALLASKINYEWELSLHHEPIHDGLDMVLDYYVQKLDYLDREERKLVEGFLIYLRFVACGMRVEDALNINNAPMMNKHIDDMFAYAETTLPMDARVKQFNAASETGSEESALYSWLANKLNTCNHYFSAVNEVAKLFEMWRRTPDESQWLDVAKSTDKKVVEAMTRIDDAWFVSELRAHHRALQKLMEFGSSHRHSFDDFSIIYCFPFVIRDFHKYKYEIFDHKFILLKHIQKNWSKFKPELEDKRRWPQLDKLNILHIKPKELTDVWTAESYMSDYAALRGENTENEFPDAALYKIVSLYFPSVYVGDFSITSRSIRVSCEIELTTFGNHHLRMACTRSDFQNSDPESSDSVTVHDIYCALRRASSLAGSEPMWVEDPSSREDATTPEAYTLFGVAESLVGRLSRALEERFGQSAIIYRDLPKTSSVVCSVRKVTSDDKSDFVFGARLPDDYLSRLLLKSAGGPADRLEPWLCRNASADSTRNAAGDDLVEDALIYKTYNTTFISLPNCPNFICLDYEEMAEFVSTLDPLYIYWNNEINDSLCAILARLRRPSLWMRTWRSLRAALAQLRRTRAYSDQTGSEYALEIFAWSHFRAKWVNLTGKCSNLATWIRDWAKVFLGAMARHLRMFAQWLRREPKPFTLKDLRISETDCPPFRQRAAKLMQALWIKIHSRATRVNHHGGLKALQSKIAAAQALWIKIHSRATRVNHRGGLKALHLRIAAAKQSATEIRSPGLVTNSVYRAFLDRLIASSAVYSLEHEFDKLTATTHEIQKAVEEKKRSSWQSVFAVIAILIGISQAQPFFPETFKILIRITGCLERFIIGIIM